jgi:hypothetical protein
MIGRLIEAVRGRLAAIEIKSNSIRNTAVRTSDPSVAQIGVVHWNLPSDRVQKTDAGRSRLTDPGDQT